MNMIDLHAFIVRGAGYTLHIDPVYAERYGDGATQTEEDFKGIGVYGDDREMVTIEYQGFSLSLRLFSDGFDKFDPDKIYLDPMLRLEFYNDKPTRISEVFMHGYVTLLELPGLIRAAIALDKKSNKNNFNLLSLDF